jgi:hypothetical protein
MTKKFGGITVGQHDTDDELLAHGFSKVGEMSNDENACPHCGVVLNGPDSVILQGDSIICASCGRSVLDEKKRTRKGRKRRKDSAINRHEFNSAWEEIFNPTEGDQDYE